MNFMNCQKCGVSFPENELDYSHDVPRYLFSGDRNQKKNQADKYGTHLICKKCHDIYERMAFSVMINSLPLEIKRNLILVTKTFAEKYFKRGEKDGNQTI